MSRTGQWDRRTIVKAAGAGLVAALGAPLAQVRAQDQRRR